MCYTKKRKKPVVTICSDILREFLYRGQKPEPDIIISTDTLYLISGPLTSLTFRNLADRATLAVKQCGCDRCSTQRYLSLLLLYYLFEEGFLCQYHVSIHRRRQNIWRM